MRTLGAITFQQSGFKGCKCGKIVYIQISAKITSKSPVCLGSECWFNTFLRRMVQEEIDIFYSQVSTDNAENALLAIQGYFL